MERLKEKKVMVVDVFGVVLDVVFFFINLIECLEDIIIFFVYKNF